MRPTAFGPIERDRVTRRHFAEVMLISIQKDKLLVNLR
jgi:hypothetical protein